MRALWHALHAKLVRSTGTLSFQKQFEAMRRQSDRLHRFPDPAALLDHLHAPGGNGTERNAILRELVSTAQAEADDCAVTVMILAIWPGVDAVNGRLRRHYRLRPEDLVAEISARVVISIRTLNLDRVTWVAATIVRNIERDIRRELRAGWAETALRAEMPEEIAAGHHRSFLGWPDGFHADPGLLSGQLQRWVGADADLLMAVAVVGETQEEAGARVGLGADAARKRYQRARQRLRTRLAELRERLSRTAAGTGFFLVKVPDGPASLERRTMHEASRDLRRLPGLFRRWEVAQILEPGLDYHLEDAGRTSDGAPLVAVYRGERRHPATVGDAE